MEKDGIYEAPRAELEHEEVTEDAGGFHPPQRVRAGQGPEWVGKGFRLFLADPLSWCLIIVFMGGLSIASNFNGILSLAYLVCSNILGGGLYIGIHSLARGEGLRFSHLFSCFNEKALRLILTFLLALVMSLAAVLVTGVVGYFLIPFDELFGSGNFVSLLTEYGGLLFLLFAILMVLLLPVFMAVAFVLPQIAIHDQALMDAVRHSFRACVLNWASLTLYGLVWLGLGIAISIPFAIVGGIMAAVSTNIALAVLGLLGFALYFVAYGTFFGSIYSAYRDIFTRSSDVDA